MTLLQDEDELGFPPADADEPREVDTTPITVDRWYRRVARTGGIIMFVLLGIIGLFLLISSWGALQKAGLGFFTTQAWGPDADPPEFGIAAVIWGTVVVAVIALVIAVPLSIGTALFINEYAPRWLRRPLTSVIDLLAAVPSLIFGIWGRAYLNDAMFGFANFLTSYLDFIPFFRTENDILGNSLFVAGMVVSLMVLPICTAVIREVFAQAPPGEKEAALALGGTRWGMIRTVILPFGRGGIVGGSMLGLGRALGETIAVALILSPSFEIVTRILEPGGNTVAATIANEFPEAKPFGVQALLAAGLALFVLTLVVNMVASAVVSRSRSGQGVEL
jgi:phosphate transport system permease protein